jgi:hypothetical protein
MTPLVQLVLARLQAFYRGRRGVLGNGFPLLIVVALASPFAPTRGKSHGGRASGATGRKSPRRAGPAIVGKSLTFAVQIDDEGTSRRRLRTGRTDLVVLVSTDGSYQYVLDRSRAESRLARTTVHEALQRAAGRTDPVPTLADQEMTEPGSRYIDFLVPGLVGMGLMGGGLWGVGFAIVDMRIRKLLKRFVATPMRRSDFLLGIMISRLVFMIPEVVVILIFARLFFGVVVAGSFGAVLVLILVGAFTFAASGSWSRAGEDAQPPRPDNLTMLPMWLLSGIFFSPTISQAICRSSGSSR